MQYTSGEFATGILLCFSFSDQFYIVQIKATKEQQATDAKHAKDVTKRAEKDAMVDEESGPFVDHPILSRPSSQPAKANIKNRAHNP